MIIGEKMSEVVDAESVVEGMDGRLYKDFYSHRMGSALHLAPTLYARLYRAIKEREGHPPGLAHSEWSVEVWHNHASDTITVEAHVRGAEVLRAYRVEHFTLRRINMKMAIDGIIQELYGIEAAHVS